MTIIEEKQLRILLMIGRAPTTRAMLRDQWGVAQTNRILHELIREGLVRETADNCFEVTPKGRLALRKVEAPREKVLFGKVARGLGEGKYYVSLGHYKRHLTRLLGVEPFEGTLNLAVHPADRTRFLERLSCTLIPGFATKQRTYGSVQFYAVTVAGRACGLLLPTRATYGPEKVELVAPVNLRREFNLRDGDVVVVEEGSV